MKRIILALALFAGSTSIYAQTEVKNDTIAVNNASIQKVVLDETTSSNGKKVTKYYFMYENRLIPASKSVAEMYNLCRKHGAECALVMVVNRKSHRKHIILD